MIAGAFGQDAEIEMVLQIAADARKIMHRLDPDRRQVIGRADARQHEDLRLTDNAGALMGERRKPTTEGALFLRRQLLDLGTELGQEGLKEFTQLKIINIAR